MTKLDGLPLGHLTREQLAERLGMSTENLKRTGLVEFMPYYLVGSSKLYLERRVRDVQLWRYAQQSLARRGLATASPPAPYLPPGETVEKKWEYLDEWLLSRDGLIVDCPVCGDLAVCEESQVWCPDCGIS